MVSRVLRSVRCAGHRATSPLLRDMLPISNSLHEFLVLLVSEESGLLGLQSLPDLAEYSSMYSLAISSQASAG